MASNFSCIGFPVASGDDFVTLAEQVASIATPVEAKAGTYLRWSPPTGEELWLQVDRGNHLRGMNPHFRGRSSMRVRVDERIRRDDHTVLDGAFHAFAMPEGDGDEAQLYPFVFDAPDADVHASLALPATVLVQLAAFASQAECFPSPEAFAASPRGGRFASKAFIPSGLFSMDGETLDAPRAYVILIGHVLESATLENHLTHLPYHWALIDTYGGMLDAVIDPALLPETPPQGGVMMGSFWVSGRILGGENDEADA